MSDTSNYDFSMERRLYKLDPILHKRFTSAVFGLQHVLSNYKLLFPSFTDHTELHSLNVIDFSNQLIADQIERMNADEIFTLLMGAYLHDTGMGITEKDYIDFSEKIDFGDYFETHSRDDRSRVIRDFHNEFSAQFIRKYSALLDLPSEEHMFAVIQVSRGHRKTNMMNEEEYPTAYPLANGHTLCLPYLAALIRLADEIDITAARNSVLLYDFQSLSSQFDQFHFSLHKAVRNLRITETEFVVEAHTDDPRYQNGIIELCGKMQDTLDHCRNAVNGRTPYRITQETVRLEQI